MNQEKKLKLNMSNKSISIYFIIFAFLYFGYTVFIAGHGIHWTNSIITITAISLAAYYCFKGRVRD